MAFVKFSGLAKNVWRKSGIFQKTYLAAVTNSKVIVHIENPNRAMACSGHSIQTGLDGSVNLG